jgi:hypothetical protein
LYHWSEWHGGEHVAVKLLVAANGPALLAAAILTPFAGTMVRVSVHYGWSQVRGALFLVFATIQWLAIGVIIERTVHRVGRAGAVRRRR